MGEYFATTSRQSALTFYPLFALGVIMIVIGLVGSASSKKPTHTGSTSGAPGLLLPVGHASSSSGVVGWVWVAMIGLALIVLSIYIRTKFTGSKEAAYWDRIQDFPRQ